MRGFKSSCGRDQDADWDRLDQPIFLVVCFRVGLPIWEARSYQHSILTPMQLA